MIKQLLIKAALFIVFFAFTNTSCDKDNYRFPDVSMNIYLGLYNDLGSLGQGSYGFFKDNEGVNGLLIYRTYNDEYFVYDRTCTFEKDFSCAVGEDPENNTVVVTCPCCKSRYLLDESGDAYVFDGPAKYPLVRYQAILEGSNLHIFN